MVLDRFPELADSHVGVVRCGWLKRCRASRGYAFGVLGHDLDELAHTAIDPRITTLEHFLRLVEGILNVPRLDRFRIEVAEDEHIANVAVEYPTQGPRL